MLSAPAGLLGAPAGFLSTPAGLLSTPAGLLRTPAGVLSTPAGLVRAPAGERAVRKEGDGCAGCVMARSSGNENSKFKIQQSSIVNQMRWYLGFTEVVPKCPATIKITP